MATVQRAKGAVQLSGGATAGRAKGAVQIIGDIGPSCTLSGTITSITLESDIRAGGKTVILTLSNDTWVAAGATFDAQRQNILNGLTSAQSETLGFNNEVRDKELVTAVVRASNEVVTITLSAAAAYNITANETLTDTVPASALVTSASAVIASPTATISFEIAGTITLTEPIADKVYPRVVSTNNRSHNVSGTYTGTVVAVQARIVDDGTDTEVVTWTTIDAAPSAGNFSGNITIPSGGPYNIDVRFSNDTLTIDNGANGFLVGANVLFIGQSNAVQMFTVGSGQVPDSKLRHWTNSGGWIVPTAVMNGGVGFGNKYIADSGVPVGMLVAASGGTGLTAFSDPTNNWETYASSPYAAPLTSYANALGSDGIEAVFWSQGEKDGQEGETETNYKAALIDLISQIRTDFDNSSDEASLPVIVAELISTTAGTATDDSWQAIKNAQRGAVNDVSDTYLLTATDLVRADSLHLTAASYTIYGQRLAQITGFINGDVGYYHGPQISGYIANSSTETDIKLTHSAGNDFTPISAITGFRVLDAGTPEVISAVVRVDATTIRLTHGAVAGALTADYLYGKDPGIASLVIDNSGLNLPLEGQQVIPDIAVTGDTTISIPSMVVAATGQSIDPDVVVGDVAVNIPSMVVAATGQVLGVAGQVNGDATVSVPSMVVAATGQVLGVAGQVNGDVAINIPSMVVDIDSTLGIGSILVIKLR